MDGPRHGIRLLAASEQSAADLLQACPVLGEFGTRLVAQAADEDESVALLGIDGAETLGAGGQLLVRRDGRLPVQVYGYRVAPDRLSRLVELMGGTAGRHTPAATNPEPTSPEPVSPESTGSPVPPSEPAPTEQVVPAARAAPEQENEASSEEPVPVRSAEAARAEVAPSGPATVLEHGARASRPW
jgi:hypothetical protein